MFASLLLVAIFGCELPLYAEAQLPPPKCDETLITKIYDYWNKNGGIPQHVNERVSTLANETDLSDNNLENYISS